MRHNTRKRSHLWPALGFLTALALAFTIAQDSRTQPGAKKSVQKDPLEHLRQLTPGELWKTLSPLLTKDDLGAVERGVVANILVERGSLDAAKVSDIVSRTPWLDKKPTTVIKWVIDDGSTVAKGDKVIEFDSAPYAEALRAQKLLSAAAEAHHRAATEQLARIQRDAGIDVKLAEIDVKLAEVALAKHEADDAQRQILKLHVEKAKLMLERIKLQAGARMEKGKAEAQARKTLHDGELAKQREVETVLEGCVMRAPHAGMVVYYVPELIRGGGAGIVAVGEPMREGQKLVRICDLKQMQAITRVPESIISKVKVGQKAEVNIDAFPQRPRTGKVTQVSSVADQAAFFNKGVKVYRVQVAIDGDQGALLPGMSAQVTIEFAKPVEALRVPISAILTRGKSRYCLVQADKEMQVREVTTGQFGSAFVEITAGLKEGERVVRVPHEVIRRADAFGRP